MQLNPQLKQPVTFRKFNDPTKMRQMIFDNVLASTKARYPMENERYRLELTDVRYDKPKDFSLKDQKLALLSRRSLYWRLQGTWKLVDKATDETVDSRKATVANVPYMTQRGTFINKGSEYTVANQMRLRPGVYARKKDNGDLEAHFNIMPGSGRSFRIHMDPETGVFKMGVGNAHLPLYPILKGIGLSDNDLQDYWGKDLLNANRQKVDNSAMGNAYKKFVGGTDTEGVAQVKALQEAFSKMGLDPDVVDRSLGGFIKPAVVPPVSGGGALPTQPVQPVQPIKPMQPLQPVQPVQPVQPIQSVQPGKL